MSSARDGSDPGRPPAQVIDWVCHELGVDHARWHRLGGGNSRQTWTVADPAAGSRWLVRLDTGEGPLSGTPFDLAREAQVYRALSGSRVPVAGLRALSPDGDVMVLTFEQGTDRWKPTVLPGLLAALADLHALPAPVVDRAVPEQSAADELEVWARVHDVRSATPSPFVTTAVEVLRDTYPGEPRRLVLCHGDAGPGNVLHDDGRVRALVDWEFAHRGDPHDDLAWVVVRAELFGIPMAGIRQAIRTHYGDGFPIDQRRLDYWVCVVLLRNLVVVLAALEARPGPGTSLVHLLLRPRLQRLLVLALARLTGTSLPPAGRTPGSVHPSIMGPADELRAGLRLLSEELTGSCRRQARLLLRLAGNLAAAEPLGPPPAAPDGDTTTARLAWLADVAHHELGAFPDVEASIDDGWPHW